MMRRVAFVALCALLVSSAVATDLPSLDEILHKGKASPKTAPSPAVPVSGARVPASGARVPVSGARSPAASPATGKKHWELPSLKGLLNKEAGGIFGAPSPPAAGSDSIAEVLAANDLTILATAAQAVGLTVPSGATLFAPTNKAFAELLAALNVTSATELLAAPELVTTVLSYHVLPTAQSLAEFSDGEELETALGGDEVLTVSRTQVLQKEAPYFGYNIQLVSTGGVLPVAQVVKGDILTSEATIVHVIDHVLIPESALSLPLP